MLLIIGTIRLPADVLDAARPLMAAMVESSRAEAGCLKYYYSEDVVDRGLIHVEELWLNRTSLDQHFNTEHLAVWRESWSYLGIGERNLCVYEVGEPSPV